MSTNDYRTLPFEQEHDPLHDPMPDPGTDYRARLGLDYDPSHFQEDIYRWVEFGEGDGVVEAVAGSGKTDTLVACARLIRDGLFVAFNSHIAKELDRKLGGSMRAKTVHAVGRAVVKEHLTYIKVENRKYHWVITDFLVQQLGMVDKSTELIDARRILRKLVDLVRDTLVNVRDEDEMEALCTHHDIDPKGLDRHLPAILAEGEDRARNGRHLIDFTDMVYLPVHWGLDIPQFSWVFVDECQDLNRCQFQFVLRCRRGWLPEATTALFGSYDVATPFGIHGESRGRMLFVGDRFQAIYGFAGADADSFLNIIRTTGATQLPLSICYRCPSLVLDRVRASLRALTQQRGLPMPDIQDRPGAPLGVVRMSSGLTIHEELVAGDLILCRANAPLITLCIDLIGRGVNARVKGRDVGRLLCEVLDALSRYPEFTYGHILEHLEDWREFAYSHLEDVEASDGAYERVDDKVAAIQAVHNSHPECVSTAELCAAIQALFSDDRPAIWLSSVHKAKGLQNPRVFILAPEKLPLQWENQQDWEFAQEINLLYVAYTRVQEELIFIT